MHRFKTKYKKFEQIQSKFFKINDSLIPIFIMYFMILSHCKRCVSRNSWKYPSKFANLHFWKNGQDWCVENFLCVHTHCLKNWKLLHFSYFWVKLYPEIFGGDKVNYLMLHFGTFDVFLKNRIFDLAEEIVFVQ